MKWTDETRQMTDELIERLNTEMGEGDAPVLLAFAPGRSEIAGNHTDHEGGSVIAAAVDRYTRGAFRANGTKVIRLASEGYAPFELDLTNLEPSAQERGTTAALVRGLAACMADAGVEPAGFDAVVSSNVAAGSGLSSSAAFELLMARAMNALWAQDAFDAERLALMSQRAERTWFGKPCGLMDQASIALGGVQNMSFADPTRIAARSIDIDFGEEGYDLCLVAVGSDHADLIDEYAAVPGEMQQVARACGKERLGELEEADVVRELPALRAAYGDRAVLRTLHYFREETLVARRVDALVAHDMPRFLGLTTLSGCSSAMYLQNVSLWGREQSAMVALALADEILDGRGACRIHGGGFGGTIQAFVPHDLTEQFSRGMDAVFGEGACGIYSIDHEGAFAQWA